MSAGRWRVAREGLSIELHPGDEYTHRGETFRVIRAAYLHRQTWWTRIFRAMTFGLWPFGASGCVAVIKEERGSHR